MMIECGPPVYYAPKPAPPKPKPKVNPPVNLIDGNANMKTEFSEKDIKAIEIKRMVDNYYKNVNKRAKELARDNKTFQETGLLSDDIQFWADSLAKQEMEEKLQKVLGFTADGIGKTQKFNERQAGQTIDDSIHVPSMTYYINQMYCLEAMQGRSEESIMESLSIWGNMDTLKDEGYYEDDSYTEEVLYNSIFGEQETKMEMIQQFVLQYDNPEEDEDPNPLSAIGVEDNIGGTEYNLIYSAYDDDSLDRGSDCTAFAQNIFAIFNSTEDLVSNNKNDIGIGATDYRQMESSLYEEGTKTSYEVGDFIYYGGKGGDPKNFKHVVLVVGIDADDNYIVAHAASAGQDFIISTFDPKEKDVMGTLNILGGTP